MIEFRPPGLIAQKDVLFDWIGDRVDVSAASRSHGNVYLTYLHGEKVTVRSSLICLVVYHFVGVDWKRSIADL